MPATVLFTSINFHVQPLSPQHRQALQAEYRRKLARLAMPGTVGALARNDTCFYARLRAFAFEISPRTHQLHVHFVWEMAFNNGIAVMPVLRRNLVAWLRSEDVGNNSHVDFRLMLDAGASLWYTVRRGREGRSQGAQ